MPDSSTKESIVRRSGWRKEDIALICGIANAGGGSLMISSGTSNQTRRMKHIRKSFESIPRLTQQELGLTCVTEPVMDGVELCLEVRIPAPEFPLRYRNRYYLYADGINTVVTKDILDRLFAQQKDLIESKEAENEPGSDFREDMQQDRSRTLDRAATSNTNTRTSSNAQKDSTRKATFKERSIAAANRLDLTSTDEFVLKVLETNGRVTAIRIAEVLGVSESTVRRSFRRLRETGLIERIGSDKAGYWRLID